MNVLRFDQVLLTIEMLLILILKNSRVMSLLA